MPNISLIWAIGALVVVLAITRVLRVGSRDPRMPRGPPTVPVLGNLHQVPITGIHKKFREWANQYGGVYSLKFGPTNVIVLCDRKAVHELIDKKGVNYAGRPYSYVGNMMTRGDHMVVSPLDTVTKTKRKVATHNLAPKMLEGTAAPIQGAEITVLMLDMLNTPENFYKHVRRVTASIANILIFGQRGVTYDTFWGSAVYEAIDKFGQALEPGANPPVDEYPFLRYVPTKWAKWKKRALRAGLAMDGIWGKARRLVEERRAVGDHRHCIADRLLDEYNESGFPMTQHAFDMLLGEMCEGGAETTSSSMLTMILAVTRFSAVQHKARAEIDKVCGSDRSPDWSDFKDIPYINCIVKEGMRWRPVISSGLPHQNIEEDYYEGMLIPKGSTIFLPVWALNNSESLGYNDPENFNPDRYLNHPKLANDYAGSADYNDRDKSFISCIPCAPLTRRRMCPGIHLAERNQWRITAKLLWAFEFSELEDPKTGRIIPLDTNAYTVGLLHSPVPFKLNIKPRSQAHVNTIRREAAEALASLKTWE
ncbi:MAG: hypothetical protein M1818_003908 [Claussenomyces sp. TS43310]|nr:MAG: hypothetical protein M1818_003908 [Claussenomyces sp. TS43310]